jgi:hypothetical protein
MSRQVLARMTRFHVRTSADRLETVFAISLPDSFEVSFGLCH